MLQPMTGPQAILIGTASTLSLLLDQLRLLPDAPLVRGIVRFEDDGAPAIGDSAEVEPTLRLRDLAGLAASTPGLVGIVSLPRALASVEQASRSALRDAGIAERVVPPLNELLERAPSVGGNIDLRGEVDVTELIGRTPYGIDRRAVAGLLEGRRVLITGAGGSIGSEIARICATFKPGKLMLMERSENALFEIDRQIGRKFPGVSRAALLHDVTDESATMRLVLEHRPDVIFHAAAHKHVPLMEDHPAHALTNNLFGTKSVADAALAAGASHFILISSDKAVNPTSVMGATKRLAEMYIQGLHKSGRRMNGQRSTNFGMVRFGNVLGSACSVLPIWGNQLREGGPVTVTDPRMTRYFMTIHEAAMLVIQSAAIPAADDAAVHVLDMGEPVKILELAMRFVAAHGYVPQLPATVAVDDERRAIDFAIQHDLGVPAMEIAFTGKRPGEKLHEELCYAAEQLRETPFPGINAWAGELRADFNLAAMVAELGVARTLTDREGVVRAIRKHVPEMRPEGFTVAEVKAAELKTEAVMGKAA